MFQEHEDGEDFLLRPIPQCGDPPWFVFLLVNVSETASKKTDIRIHSLPNVVEFVQNIIRPGKSQLWRIVMAIGEFHRWENAIAFSHKWENGKRGCKSRVLGGFELFGYYREAYKLCLYITPNTKDETIQSIMKNKECNPIFNVLSECQKGPFYNFGSGVDDNNDNDDSISNVNEMTSHPSQILQSLTHFVKTENHLEHLDLNQRDYEKAKMWWNLGKNNNNNNDDDHKKIQPFQKTLAYIFKTTS